MSSALLNPFVAGGAIGDPAGRGFYGREDIFKFVRDSLNAVQRPPLLLIGQRRIGKSSILKQIPAHLPADHICVYYDLQGQAEVTLDEVIFGLGRAIADAVSIPRPDEAEAAAATFPDFLNKAIAALGSHPERLVLLFDEFDVVDQQFARPEIAAQRFIPYVGRLSSRFPGIGYVFVVGRRTEELSEGSFSAVLKDTKATPIGRLGRSETERLVLESFGSHAAVSQAALDEIYVLTAGHPFCAQMLCSAIWDRFVQAGSPAGIGSREVDDALSVATREWTNGLNWTYDGLEKSAQRLFLSALAGLSGANALGSVSFNAIHTALFERRVGVDESELRLTPRDLVNWDVIEGSTAGFRFSVPMIGLWIRKYRPLEDLEQETRLINPRAAKYYDLAIDSQARGDLDAAIADFRNALEANPVYLEAQLGLASALRARKGRSDLEASIEAFERVVELDPNSAPTPLLEALVEIMEANRTDVSKAVQRFKRISALDSSGLFRERARRILQRMAQVRLAYGTETHLKEAAELYTLIGDAVEAERARGVLTQIDRIDGFCIKAWLISSGLWAIAAALPQSWAVARLTRPFLPLALASIAGQAISVPIICQHDGRLPFRRQGWVALLVGYSLSYLAASRWVHEVGWQGVMAFGAVFILNFAINPGLPDRPRELSYSTTTDDRPGRSGWEGLTEGLADLLDGWAGQVRNFGKRYSRSGAKSDKGGAA